MVIFYSYVKLPEGTRFQWIPMDSTELSAESERTENLLRTTFLALGASSSDGHCTLVTPDILRGVLKWILVGGLNPSEQHQSVGMIVHNMEK